MAKTLLSLCRKMLFGVQMESRYAAVSSRTLPLALDQRVVREVEEKKSGSMC